MSLYSHFSEVDYIIDKDGVEEPGQYLAAYSEAKTLDDLRFDIACQHNFIMANIALGATHKLTESIYLAKGGSLTLKNGVEPATYF